MGTRNILITGGAGFFGDILKRELLNKGYHCVSIDLEDDEYRHKNLVSYKGDIRDKKLLDKIAKKHNFYAVFHTAAMLAHAVKNKDFLWESNVTGTRNVAEVAKKYGIKKVIFTSSNCLWGKGLDHAITEEDAPFPVEIYGRSKLEGEQILLEYKNDFNVVIFRCPTIIDAGRLGLLAILFEFIDEGRKVWVVGGGDNRYQFIYAQDLVDACIKSLDYSKSNIFNIGADNVPTFKEAYEFVIDKAHTKARVTSFSRKIALPLMKLAHVLRLSPLGPYQYKMIAENFVFDTTKIKKELDWKPKLTNQDMLYKAYEYYHQHRKDIEGRHNASAHKQAARMGVIRLLKWLS
ncbi:NAD(P)-dependent oxidoreductase [Patescibacteria group bacterium]|nr:MAG: NAD(P)-dependent oxidoreductase [Patescibacteria group bacterium]